jgi:hypothetical protein
MRDLIGIGLALFLGMIGLFFAFGGFGAVNGSSQIQETFAELAQARTELNAYAAQNGGYGTTAFTPAEIIALGLLPAEAISGGTNVDQWDGAIAITGNGTSFFADYSNIDPVSCARLIVKIPTTSGVTGVAVASATAGLPAATVNAIPIGAATATALCTATMAVRFVVSG